MGAPLARTLICCTDRTSTLWFPAHLHSAPTKFHGASYLVVYGNAHNVNTKASQPTHRTGLALVRAQDTCPRAANSWAPVLQLCSNCADPQTP